MTHGQEGPKCWWDMHGPAAGVGYSRRVACATQGSGRSHHRARVIHGQLSGCGLPQDKGFISLFILLHLFFRLLEDLLIFLVP